MRVIQNPMQPGFNHYLFESVAALIKQGCAKDPGMIDKLEEMLIPPFNYVLSQDVQVDHMGRGHDHAHALFLQFLTSTIDAKTNVHGVWLSSCLQHARLGKKPC